MPPASVRARLIAIATIQSVVIGETARVGNNCTILHSVTLGGTGKERGDRHPKIADSVVLGAGCTVLGNINVGDGATVGSQAVVTKDVPAGMTVVGLNKLLDPNISPARQDTVKQRYETWYDLAASSSSLLPFSSAPAGNTRLTAILSKQGPRVSRRATRPRSCPSNQPGKMAVRCLTNGHCNPMYVCNTPEIVCIPIRTQLRLVLGVLHVTW